MTHTAAPLKPFHRPLSSGKEQIQNKLICNERDAVPLARINKFRQTGLSGWTDGLDANGSRRDRIWTRVETARREGGAPWAIQLRSIPAHNVDFGAAKNGGQRDADAVPPRPPRWVIPLSPEFRETCCRRPTSLTQSRSLERVGVDVRPTG